MGENTLSDAELADFRTIDADEISSVNADAIASVNQAALPDTSIKYAEVVVSTAELLALFTTPKTLVAAPGAGYVLEFISAVLILDYVSAAYATRGDLSVANETGTEVSNDVTLANLLAKTADTIIRLSPLNTDDTGVPILENEALELICATGNPATGDSPLRVKVAYRVHATGL